MYINYNNVRSSRAKVVTASFSSIPWESAWHVWKEAADAAEELAVDVMYTKMVHQRKEQIGDMNTAWEFANPEGGSYESNFDDELPSLIRPTLANRKSIRRKAGNKAVIEEFVANYIIGDATEQILPSLVLMIKEFTPRVNDTGLYSGLYLLEDYFNTDKMKGILRFLLLEAKSCYLPTQYKAPAKTFSTLVPFIMYCFRLHKGIPYSKWDPEEIGHIVHNNLVEAMLWDGDIPDKDKLIVGRDQGLTVQSGKTIGNKRSAVSTFKLYATKDTCYEGMPELVQVMLSQIWLAHPDNRTKYMVLDPKSWDSVPVPLIATEIFKPVDIVLANGKIEKSTPWD